MIVSNTFLIIIMISMWSLVQSSYDVRLLNFEYSSLHCKSDAPCNDSTVVICTDSVANCYIHCDGQSICNNLIVLSSAQSTDVRCSEPSSCQNLEYYCGDLSYTNRVNVSNYISNLDINLTISLNNDTVSECALECWDNDACDNVFMGCYGTNIRQCDIEATSNDSFIDSTIECDTIYENTETECQLSCDLDSCFNITMLCEENLDSCKCIDISTDDIEQNNINNKKRQLTSELTRFVAGDGACEDVFEVGYVNDSSILPTTTNSNNSGSGGGNNTKDIVYISIIAAILLFCCGLVVFMYAQWKRSNRTMADNYLVQSDDYDQHQQSMLDTTGKPGSSGYTAPLIQMEDTQQRFQL